MGIPASASRVGTYWSCDVLEDLLAKISKIERDLATDVFASGSRDADATGLSDPLKPRRDVDAIPENVVSLIRMSPTINPDPEQHAAVCRDTFVPLVLHGYRAL